MNAVSQAFAANVEQVYELATFDEVILQVAISRLETLQEQLKGEGVENPRLLVTQALKTLKSVKTNGSLATKYTQMLNQCVVLLTSYFGSAVADVFREIFPLALNSTTGTKLLQEELKLTLGEIREVRQLPTERLGEWFLKRKDLSFQDLQSIARSFKDYLGIAMPKDQVANDIILGHAARHAIVHARSRVDRRMLGQVVAAIPRTLKPTLADGEDLAFSIEDLHLLGDAMKNYVERLEGAAESKWRHVIAAEPE